MADVVRMTATLAAPLSLPEVAEGTLPGPGSTPVQLPVSDRAQNNISLTPSRKRRDRPEVLAAAEGPSQQTGAERDTPKKQK